MLIALIRHGMTELSEEKRYQGVLDTPLSARGRAALHRAGICPAYVYVSPMLRARQTAEILFPEAEQRVIADLREMEFGAFEGRGWWEMEEDPAYRRWVSSGCTERCPGGEDMAEFSMRVTEAFAAIVERELSSGSPEMTVVAHGGTQMAVLSQWADPAHEYFRWQTECGRGWMLDTEGWPARLQVTGEFDGLT